MPFHAKGMASGAVSDGSKPRPGPTPASAVVRPIVRFAGVLVQLATGGNGHVSHTQLKAKIAHSHKGWASPTLALETLNVMRACGGLIAVEREKQIEDAAAAGVGSASSGLHVDQGDVRKRLALEDGQGESAAKQGRVDGARPGTRKRPGRSVAAASQQHKFLLAMCEDMAAPVIHVKRSGMQSLPNIQVQIDVAAWTDEGLRVEVQEWLARGASE
jgi:hypothetical protein